MTVVWLLQTMTLVWLLQTMTLVAVLAQQIDDVATKAAMSFEPPPDAPEATSTAQQQAARRRAAAFARAFSAHLERLQHDAAAYGRLGLAELFELREECLREFGFQDIYKCDSGSIVFLQLFSTDGKRFGRPMRHWRCFRICFRSLTASPGKRGSLHSPR